MKVSAQVLCCILLSPSSIPIDAQEGKVVVVIPESKELKRTAHRLRIPVERLRNVREALQEATELAKRARPIQGHYFRQLADSWVHLNRSKAESAIGALFSELKSTAQGATEIQEYTSASVAAQELLRPLAQLDPELSLNLARGWPRASPALGLADQEHYGLEQQIRGVALQHMVNSNPDAALSLLSSAAEPQAEDGGIRSSLAVQLIQAGRREEGLRLIDRAISDFATAKLGPSTWGQYLHFLQNVSRVAPDRFLDAFEILAKSPAAPEPVQVPGTLMMAGDQTITLDPTEAMALNALRGIHQRPELLLKALDAVPSLRSKMEQAGGVDNALDAEIGFRYGSRPGQMRRFNPNGSDYRDGDHVDVTKLYSQLRGKTSKNAQFVRSELIDEMRKPEDASWLLQLAHISNWEDPDLASLALELAKPLVGRVDPLQNRVSLFQQLLQTIRLCEGEVDSGLIKEGFLLADELRQDMKEQYADLQISPGNTQADHFEVFLLADLSRDNFAAAIKYVRSMSDESLKLMALLQIIQSCRYPY